MLRFTALAAGLTLLTGGVAAAQTPVSPPAAASAPSPAVAAGAAFLATNAKAPGVVVLPSGLQYKIVASGPKTAESPKIGDIIKVHYEGKLLDGTVFDSSFERNQPAIMPLDGLVQAWLEALPMMHVGDEWVLYVPAELGYGDRDVGPIPAGSMMVFRLKLLGMLSVD